MTTEQKFRVVLDTNQIIQAGSRWLDPIFHTPNNAARELIRAVAREHTGLYSGKIMGEYVEKLLDLGHPPKRVERYCALMYGAFEFVKVTTKSCNPSPSDLDDIVFLLCAIDGKADLLVSEDGHLLALKSSYVDFRILNQSEAITELGI